MIDLAPSHKSGLPLASPLIAGGGAFGFADEYASLVDFSRFGAFITNPITLRPRTPANGQRVLPFPGGALIHTGLPNPGLPAALRDNDRKWATMGLPIILHLAATTVEDVIDSMKLLERNETVVGIEIGFRDDEPLADAEALLRAAAQNARQPVIVSVPFARALTFSRLAEKSGAQALTVSAPPRGTLRHGDEWVTGRLYGASLFPQALNLVRKIKTQTALPIIGAGGVHSHSDVEALLAAGATAVQIDSVVWVDPSLVNGLNRFA